MDKKAILEKARASQIDEREEQIEMKSYHIGWIGVTAIMLILLALRAYFNESSADIVIILMAQTGATSFYHYKKKTKKRTMYLVAGIASIVAILLGFSALLTQYGVF